MLIVKYFINKTNTKCPSISQASHTRVWYNTPLQQMIYSSSNKNAKIVHMLYIYITRLTSLMYILTQMSFTAFRCALYTVWAVKYKQDTCIVVLRYHDDVMKWKHFPRYWPFVRRIHRSTVNSPHKGQWRGALVFSLICVWINGWVNNREAGDRRRHQAHYDVIVMRVEKQLISNKLAQNGNRLSLRCTPI